jgi:hypothetical protein
VTTHSDLTRLEVQISTLYVCNPRGDLKFIREPGYDESELDPAPRFFMGRSRDGNTWRFRHDLPEEQRLELDALCRLEATVTNFEEEPNRAQQIRAVLEAHKPITSEYRGPAFWLPEDSSTASDAVLVTEENAGVLEKNFAWKLTSRNSFRIGVFAATVVDGDAVSICYCARLTDVTAEAGVETLEAARGQGYAGAAVATWASVIRARGLTPLYSTSWDKAASRAVARKLRAVLYAEDWSIT